jgi:hypothetical protein
VKNVAKMKKSNKTETKKCKKCGESKPLNSFYSNKDHVNGLFKDDWCKDCVKNFVKNKETLKEYCLHNKKVFSEELFDKSVEEAEMSILGTDTYRNAGQKMGEVILWSATRDHYFSKMNMKNYYIYANDAYNLTDLQLEDLKIKPNEETATPTSNKSKTKVQYSDVWKGRYTVAQIERLDGYFNRLAENFDITDIHMEDMYREVAKIAMERDEAFNEYKSNRDPNSFKLYKELCDMYIKMSDAAKLSVSKRTKNDSVGFSDLGSLIKRIEESGALMRKVEFEKDDVDIVVEDFAHILRSFEGESFEDGVGNE